MKKAILVGLLLGATLAAANAAMQPNALVVRAVRGSATWQNDGDANWRKLSVGVKCQEGALLQTGHGSLVDLFLGDNGPVVRLTENTTLLVRTLQVDRTHADPVIDTELDLRAGRILANVKKLAAASKYIVNLPNCQISVRGTRFEAKDDGTVTVIEGQVVAKYRVANTDFEPVLVQAGQTATPPTTAETAPAVVAAPPAVLQQYAFPLAEVSPSASPPAAPSYDPLSFYRRNPELMKRYFPHLQAGEPLQSPPSRYGAQLAPAQPAQDLFDGGKAKGLADLHAEDADELWIIQRKRSAPNEPDDDTPGTGALIGREEGSEREVPLPLRATEVRARVLGQIATVNVEQQFANPFRKKIEAIYVFPLPESAAVSEFLMIVGDRRIRGLIREREEAEQLYEQAKAEGYTASLLTQERPNIFTQKVANIEPGKPIDISISYYHAIPVNDGWCEFVFPMVVGPRFNPSGSSGIGAVQRGSSGKSGQNVELEYLRSNERSAHEARVTLDLAPGMPIEEHSCTTHAVQVRPKGDGLRVTIDKNDRLPNKDFVFRYRLSGSALKSSFVTHRAESGGYFAFTIVPPALPAPDHRRPVELVFVVDCSGSMNGYPIQQAKAAVERGLKMLQPDDSFQLINFSMSAGTLSDKPLPATRVNIQRALKHLHALQSEGGTMMIEGIKAALDFPHDPKRLRYVAFLTDGYIGNESEILREVRQRLGQARIFSCGIGSSVNRHLLDSMARLGHGAVAYIGPDESAAEVMQQLIERVRQPILTEVSIDWRGLEVKDVFPRKLPDLIAGRSVLVTGRFHGELPRKLKIQGSLGDSTAEHLLPIAVSDHPLPALASIWARQKIAELSQHGASKDKKNAIRDLALKHGILSDYTAFLALDASRVSEGDSETVPVAVPVPEGVNPQTTVTR